MADPVIQVSHLQTYLGGKWVHRDINFSVSAGKIVAIVGGSGSGKSVLLRQILGLLKPAAGKIEILGNDLETLYGTELQQLQHRCGILFQQGALFSALTVLENIAFPLRKFSALTAEMINEIALLKLALVGLTPDAAQKYPAELSGGMQKRVALARALILDPELLFLDEPSAGLDPVSAADQDNLLLELQKSLHLTVVIVTHDLNTLATITDEIIFLGEGKVLAEGTFKELMHHTHPEVAKYFHSSRAKAASGLES